MKRDSIQFQFLKKKSNLDDYKLIEILKRAKCYSFAEKEELKFSIREIENYVYFIINSNGVILSALNSISGNQCHIFLDAETFFPMTEQVTMFFNPANFGSVCRKAEILALKKEDVQSLRMMSPDFNHYMLSVPLKILDDIISRMLCCQKPRVRKRIVAALISCIEKYGYQLSEDELIIHISHAELAALAVSTEVNVSKILKELREAGMLRTGWKSIIVKREYYEKWRNMLF